MENTPKCCVKVYLCSNPEDSEAEREALRETVFPRVRDRCRRVHGVEFRVIDPYEGVGHQSPPDPRTRLRLLDECRKSSAGPFFVALVGQRYGSACPPVQVEVSEFQTLLWTCEQMGLSTRLLERRYRRDENAVPPSFVLRDRPHHPAGGQTDDTPGDADGSQQEIGATFRAAVTRCVQEGRFTSEKAHEYFSSALEKEVRFALEERPLEDAARALCYVHKPPAVRSQEQRVLDSDPMTNLREHLLPGLVAPGQLPVRTSSVDSRRRYIDGLCQQLYDDLLTLIDRTLVREESRPSDALSQDLLRNLELCRIYASMYRVECPETERIQAYLEHGDTGHPLVISGGACTGKTALLSHCAVQVRTWLDGRNPVVVARFVGSDKVTLQELLRSVCYQITVNYGEHPWLHTSRNLIQLSQDFRSLLITASTSQRPLVLIFDGLDQMGLEEDKSLSLWWLPKSLPANVKLLISTTPKKSGTLRALRALYPKSHLFLELGSKDRRDLSQMLVDLLLARDRRITSGQRTYVNRALATCPLPLCVELLCEQVCEWSSDSEVTENSVTSGVHNNITLFFSQLEKKHSRQLVSRALCYLTLARQGLTEAELTDVLSSDNSVFSHFVPGGQVLPYKLRLPEVAVEMLLLDLERFLVRRHVAGSEVLFWTCRHFPLVIQKLYPCSTEAMQEMHAALADVFSGRWANGRTKSLVVCGSKGSKPQDVVPDVIPVKTDIDRLHPDQPWIFRSAPSMTLTRANLRKILELPFHLKSSGRLEELGRTVMSLGFHQAMLQAGHLEELISQLEEISVLMFRQELRLLARILRDSSCLLRGSPENLPVVMQAELFPFLDVLPSLESYAKQISEEGMKSNRLAVVQSSAAAVPSASWMLSDVDGVPLAEVLELQCNTAVIILQNCSMWAWNENIPGSFELIHSFGLKFSSAKGTQHFVLLSTQCPRLFLCDIHTPLCVLEIDVRSSMPDGSTEPSSRPPVEGFLVLESTMFVSYKDTRYIGVFNVNTGEGLRPLLCPSNVSCVSGCPSGQLVLCGQDDGMVSVFAVQENCHLATCSIPAGRPIIEILHESERSFVCVDSTGGIYVWDTETTADPRPTNACCLTEGEEWVLNTEHSWEDGVFVVCKSQQIFLLDTCEWTVEEQFSAPAGRKFTRAVLAKVCSLVIASLEECPFLLVWKRTTGQCILNLDTGHTQGLRLLKLQSTLLALTENGVLTAWDLDLVFNVSSIARSGASVKKILLESAEGHFYTMDGTEFVWRWGTRSGSVQGVFQHESPVETLALSADDKHLVAATLTDTYVWHTATGQNVQRICSNSSASYLLVTPNSNFAVSLCERGLSPVWKLRSGHVVCNIHLYLRNAIISPESTFVLGLHEQDLLAVSLWSGCVSRRFSCSTQMDVVAFQPLLNHVDYVVVITSSGCLFTWRVTEETLCQHVQIPCTFLSQPDMIQFSSDGRYAVLSAADDSIGVLDTQNGRLCLLPAEGQVLLVSLDVAGRYIVFVCEPKPSDCTCRLHSGPVLCAASVSDGRSAGRFPLGAVPSALSLSEELRTHVGFEDGSAAVYAICAAPGGRGAVRGRFRELGRDTRRVHEEPLVWSALTAATVTWVDSASVA
ncbi:NACHT and WD repeat domain-containing protein 2 [Scleropages formosus]|uniref:NACHT and WD repeat domain-containing protein 2 n=1 Tax=Scleropages formosus TaxID=113540 RepID=UPI0010FA7223|nr:NACHT and WD repeat domain-containing protein 2-like [Scleropages formosus]